MEEESIGALAQGLGVIFGFACLWIGGALIVGVALRALLWAAGITL